MKPGTIVLGTMLAVSLMLNLIAFARLKGREELAVASATPSSRPVREDRAPDLGRASRSLEASVPAPRELEPQVAPAAPKAAGGKPALAPVSLPVVRNDPQVLGVLEAQEEFNVFWKDLDRVFKARSKFEEPKYFQTVVSATEDFLGLPESNRAVFREAMKSAAAGLATARRDHDAARQSLPPKDKSNAATYAVYQQQKNALDVRYQEQTRQIIDGVKAHLDPKQPRHGELASNLEKLLKNLVPRPTQP